MRSGYLFLFSIFSLHSVTLCAQSEKPRLVVQIVVSQMRYDYLEKFGGNFSEKGFKRFINSGISFTDCRYDYMLTGTETSLATLTTGSMPSTHGVVGPAWVDFLMGEKVTLADDAQAYGLDCNAGVGCYSPVNLVVPTLGDRLLDDSPKSHAVTIAQSPSSAVVLGGFTKEVFWCDQSRGRWVSSSHYMARLPEWVETYNAASPAAAFMDAKWELSKPREQYVNSRHSLIDVAADGRQKKSKGIAAIFRKETFSRDYPRIYHTPPGNTLMTEFVRKAIVNLDLGQDEHTDLLNICYDTPRLVGEIFGPESMEVEDMFYRLDEELGDLIDFIHSQLGAEKTLIVLTSDHGSSDSYDRTDKPSDRFNIPQFRVVINAFMNTQYGSGDWVLDYYDRQLYLNREQIYRNGLNLQEVQNRVAAYALQFRGVSHAMTATSLSSNSFAAGHGRLMQNSFYQRRSGDVIIDLMPGWIEEQANTRSLSGSMYDYDTHVPLMVIGNGFSQRRIRAPADPSQLAPTLARLMQIDRPVAATGGEIPALTEHMEY